MILFLFKNIHPVILTSYIENENGKHTCAPQKSYPDVSFLETQLLNRQTAE